MKVTMIGSHMCQDTLYALMLLKHAGVNVDFHDIHAGFPALMDYLKLRENSPLYESVRENGRLGIPFFRLEDGTETLDVNEVLAKAEKD